jgi:ankyrin repeat protein
MDDRMRASMELERALEAGDLAAARAALGDPPDWPNVVDPYLGTTVLSMAIGCAPLPVLRQLVADGVDPNFHRADDGFPTLVDVIHHRRADRPELRRWHDAHEVLRLLLDAGADVHARGLNDWTALHFACSNDDGVAVAMLLDAGADPGARTRIDDFETPLDIAVQLDGEALRVLRGRGLA